MSAAPAHSPTAIHRAIATLDDAALAALSNAGLLRRAQKDAAGLAPETVQFAADHIAVQLPDATVTLTALTLPEARCTCPATSVCRHRLTAALLLRSATPPADFPPADTVVEIATVTAKAKPSPRSRRPKPAAAPTPSSPLSVGQQEALAQIAPLLTQLLHRGLDRLSPHAEQQLADVSHALHAQQLPRLSQLALRLADHVKAQQAGLASADTDRLLYEMSLLLALGTALEHLPPEGDLERFAGVVRRRYAVVADRDLWGCGLWQWRTASGFHGVTLALFDPKNRQFWRWSDSRPINQSFGFSPAQRYHQPAPWLPRLRLADLARRYVHLEQPQMADERLSSSKTIGGHDCGPLPADALRECSVADWGELTRMVVNSWPIGLQPAQELPLQWLRPTRWGTPTYDAIAQVLSWPLFDAADAGIALEIAYLPYLQPTLDRLIQLDPGGVTAVLALNQGEAVDRWRLVSLLTGDNQLIHLDFEPLPATISLPKDRQWLTLPTATKSLETAVDVDESATADEPSLAAPTDLAAALPVMALLQNQLRLIAERGGLTDNHRALLTPLPARFHQLLWPHFAHGIERLLQTADWPLPLLQLRYLLALHNQIAHRHQILNPP